MELTGFRAEAEGVLAESAGELADVFAGPRSRDALPVSRRPRRAGDLRPPGNGERTV
jgi:hypothetical protein